MTRRRIAVIGSGIAGLTAGYVLSRTDDVVLFEAERRLGGHAHTTAARRRAAFPRCPLIRVLSFITATPTRC
jgi:predicted NAD/FAD-binding protein